MGKNMRGGKMARICEEVSGQEYARGGGGG